MKKLVLFLYVFFFLIGCVPKKTYKYMDKKTINNPVKTEAIVSLPLYKSYEIWTEYVYKDFNDSVHYFSTKITSINIDVVKGEKYIVIYDSLNPSEIKFDETQCGPFFNYNEAVDTTLGKIILAKFYGKEKKWIDFIYQYQAKDSVFQKRVKCSDTSTFSNIASGKEYKVIYDPNNKGRGKMLFEPSGLKKK